MTVRSERTLPYVVERDVDMVFVQLIQTSPRFRKWFLERIEMNEGKNEFVNVRHSVVRDSGESDVEIGFETADGNRFVVLVENKINAAKQERQAERYFERGRNYVERGAYDSFVVCLIAPSHYVSDSDKRSFGNVVTYEEMLEQVEELGHDGELFFREVFERGIEKQSLTDHSELTAAIKQRLMDDFERLPDIAFLSVSNTLVKVKSDDPKHPSSVIYTTYIPGKYEGRRAEVRVEILGEASEKEREAIQSVLSDHIDELEGYRFKNKIMNPVRKDIRAGDHDEVQVDTIASEIGGLIEFYHPILVEELNTES